MNEYFVVARVGAYVSAENLEDAKRLFKLGVLRGFPTSNHCHDKEVLDFESVAVQGTEIIQCPNFSEVWTY